MVPTINDQDGAGPGQCQRLSDGAPDRRGRGRRSWFQEAGLKPELAFSQQTIDLEAVEGREGKAGEYFADLKAGLQRLNAPPAR